MSTDSNFEGIDWLTTTEAAILIRAFDKKTGKPCSKRIRNLVGKRKLTPHKPFGRLLFKKSELNKIIEAARQG